MPEVLATGATLDTRRRHISIGLGLLLGSTWFCAIAFGVIVLAAYGNTPGKPAPVTAESSWPAASQLIRRPGHKTLVLFAHPRCQCTRATLEEFHRILAQSQAIPTTYVVFTDSGHTDAEAPLWHIARAIPGVQVLKDGRNEARVFQAFTSGQTFLFDESGTLRFGGGITAARGHAGDNTGADAVLSLINAGKTSQERTFVFGCALTASPGIL